MSNIKLKQLKQLIKRIVKEEFDKGSVVTVLMYPHTAGTEIIIYKGDKDGQDPFGQTLTNNDISYYTAIQYKDIIRNLKNVGNIDGEKEVKSILGQLSDDEMKQLIINKKVVTTNIPSSMLNFTGKKFIPFPKKVSESKVETVFNNVKYTRP